MARVEGTPQYEDYYSQKPELKKVDDSLRAMTPLFEPGGLYYDEELCTEADKFYKAIYSVEPDQELSEEFARRLDGLGNKTLRLGVMARRLGAVDVGFAPMDKALLYSVKGRLDEDYGTEITPHYPSALVFLVEMDFEAMRRAPRAEAALESARCYYLAAVIAKTLEAALTQAGWKAKAHYDAHYEMILPPLAVLAGLGEVGRNNILISKRYGSRVRIGAVTLDCPVTYDSPISLGVEHFCGLCGKCSDNCPPAALSSGEPEEIRGVSKWPTNVVKCHRFWRVAGTDCGVCMAVCPFSHKNTIFHNVIRWFIRHFAWLHAPALFFDDLFYGRRWKPKGNGWNRPKGRRRSPTEGVEE